MMVIGQTANFCCHKPPHQEHCRPGGLSLTDGFSFEQACYYLEHTPWRFSGLKEKVARSAGNPSDDPGPNGRLWPKRRHETHIFLDLLESLPAEGSEASLREEICHRILGNIFEQLQTETAGGLVDVARRLDVRQRVSWKSLEQIQRSVK